MSIEYKTGILSGVGTVGGIGAVASTMSAAEITGTLATIGGIVGGGWALVLEWSLQSL